MGRCYPTEGHCPVLHRLNPVLPLFLPQPGEGPSPSRPLADKIARHRLLPIQITQSSQTRPPSPELAHLACQRAQARERPARRPIPVARVALSRLSHVDDAMQPGAQPRRIRLRGRRCARCPTRLAAAKGDRPTVSQPFSRPHADAISASPSSCHPYPMRVQACENISMDLRADISAPPSTRARVVRC